MFNPIDKTLYCIFQVWKILNIALADTWVVLLFHKDLQCVQITLEIVVSLKHWNKWISLALIYELLECLIVPIPVGDHIMI